MDKTEIFFKNLKIFNKNIDEHVVKISERIFTQLTDSLITLQQDPVLILLGGQPGTGKSSSSEKIKQMLKDNLLIINNDEYRANHPYFIELNQIYKKDATRHTSFFVGKIAQSIRTKAIQKHFNILMEGSFKAVSTPLRELNYAKKNNYKTKIIIYTCPKEESWASTIERGDEQESSIGIGRYVPKEYHDSVTQNLAKNVLEVYLIGEPDSLEIYSREAKLFDSKTNNILEIIPAIQNELDRLEQKEKNIAPLKPSSPEVQNAILELRHEALLEFKVQLGKILLQDSKRSDKLPQGSEKTELDKTISANYEFMDKITDKLTNIHKNVFK